MTSQVTLIRGPAWAMGSSLPFLYENNIWASSTLMQELEQRVEERFHCTLNCEQRPTLFFLQIRHQAKSSQHL